MDLEWRFYNTTVSTFYRETLFILIRLFTDLVWLVRSRILLTLRFVGLELRNIIIAEAESDICLFVEKIRMKCQTGKLSPLK